MKDWKIYKHTSPSGKVYIGITKQTINQRWRNGKGYKDSSYFYKAIIKYGFDAFEHQIIQTTDTLEKAQILEKMWISFYKKKNGVYNLTEGGEGNAGYVMSEETKLKISKANKGKSSWIKGKKGCIKWTEESKQKARISHKGQKPWNTGKNGYHINHHMSELQKDNLRKVNSKPVLQYDINGSFINEWESSKKAQEFLGIHRSCIGKVCKGYYKTAGGYIWKYKQN